ncbi:basic secretory protein-like protein [Pedobacter namyangjuensis]|uniref:basic secretory protein-like protein n=1 Tax=Pedobacter namyangjuensis TaxID=600626 RepID=UPI000DE3725E|nr:basic secretory protein-like protein [Pedobacter namyangjuensis]
MKKIFLLTFISFIAVFAVAQDTTTHKKDGYILHFASNDRNFDPALKKRMIETFFKVYPVLAKDFNPKTAKELYFNIDTAYKGVAATGGGKIVYNPQWFIKNPGDIDVVTHEVMHVVQNYGRGGGPGWLTEGIADYVRYKYGVDNAGAKWSLPSLKPEHSYKNSYRITARFLNWLEEHQSKGIVVKLDEAMRNHTYKNEMWAEITGKSLDELWQIYISKTD